jgi:hypothetical protein
MNDTPRTDAIAHRGYNESAYIAEMTGLARELERELAESTESLAFQTQLNREVIDLEKKTFAELAAERALADRLAEALDGLLRVHINEPKALAAWKEARRE